MKFPMHVKDTISPKDEAGPKTFKYKKKNLNLLYRTVSGNHTLSGLTFICVILP